MDCPLSFTGNHAIFSNCHKIFGIFYRNFIYFPDCEIFQKNYNSMQRKGNEQDTFFFRTVCSESRRVMRGGHAGKRTSPVSCPDEPVIPHRPK